MLYSLDHLNHILLHNTSYRVQPYLVKRENCLLDYKKLIYLECSLFVIAEIKITTLNGMSLAFEHALHAASPTHAANAGATTRWSSVPMPLSKK